MARIHKQWLPLLEWRTEVLQEKKKNDLMAGQMGWIGLSKYIRHSQAFLFNPVMSASKFMKKQQ